MVNTKRKSCASKHVRTLVTTFIQASQFTHRQTQLAAAQFHSIVALSQQKMASQRIDAGRFYAEYHGHPLEDLKILVNHLRQINKSLIYLAGDSSLDNKHWFFDPSESKHRQVAHDGCSFIAPAVNGYEGILQPPRMVKDVAYWLNVECSQLELPLAAVNCAIEESRIAQREPGMFSGSRLLSHDELIQTTITTNDYLIVSAGGNDVALAPTVSTIISMGTLTKLMPSFMIRSGWALGFGHFTRLLKNDLLRWVKNMLGETRPKAVLVCMIYYPCTKGEGWADRILTLLGYKSNPEKLQLIIRTLYKRISADLHLDGTRIIPVPLFEVLDPDDEADYVEQVEPSIQGGRKMAKAFVKLIQDDIVVHAE